MYRRGTNSRCCSKEGMFFDHSSENCKKCPEGSPRMHGYYCELCPEGLEPSNRTSFGCTPCAKGWFKATKGNHKCQKCPQGEDTRGLASLQCKTFTNEVICEKGFEPSTDLSGCTPCSKDWFKDRKGNHKCTRCPLDQGTEDKGSKICEYMCPEGSEPSKGWEGKLRTLHFQCTRCLDGWFKDGKGNHNCERCPEEGEDTRRWESMSQMSMSMCVKFIDRKRYGGLDGGKQPYGGLDGRKQPYGGLDGGNQPGESGFGNGFGNRGVDGGFRNEFGNRGMHGGFGNGMDGLGKGNINGGFGNEMEVLGNEGLEEGGLEEWRNEGRKK